VAPAEVIVVGGGIAGGALAVRLAEAGVAVTVLERELVYRDIVRGEAFVPWGFHGAVQLGVAKTILENESASVMTRMVPYDESLSIEQAQRRSRDLSTVVDGAPGVVGIGHPELREALADAATKAGATVIRGVRRSVLYPGARRQLPGRRTHPHCALSVRGRCSRKEVGDAHRARAAVVDFTGQGATDRDAGPRRWRVEPGRDPRSRWTVATSSSSSRVPTADCG
jgi:flavin-dependent dehydrogenase